MISQDVPNPGQIITIRQRKFVVLEVKKVLDETSLD